MIPSRLTPRESRTCSLALLIAATAIVFGAGCAPTIEKPTAAAEEENVRADEAEAAEETHVKVHVVPAAKREFYESVSALGQCEALPDKLAVLTPAVEGQVRQILARPGSAVKAGQPIIEFDRSIAQADYSEKIAAQNELAASLKLLKSHPRVEEQQISKLAIEHAKILVDEAQALVDHLRPLRERKEISEQKFFEAAQALAQARVQQQTAEAQYKLSMADPRPEAVEEAQSKIDVAAKAAELSKAHLELLSIKAPIDGILDSLDCHPGQTIAAGISIGDVLDNSKVFATAWLPAASAHRVKVGQTGRVRFGLAQRKLEGNAEETRVQSGRVVFVGEVADSHTGNIPIRVEIDNPGGQLAIGETLEVVVAIGESTTQLAVPVAAITDIGEGPVLSLVRDGKTVVLHPEVGPAFEGWVPVSAKDLHEGDAAIVEGGYNLPEGTEVEIVGNENQEHE